MSKVYFIGDMHFGHKNIHRLRGKFSSEFQHRSELSNIYQETVSKKDLVFFMGDAAFSQEALLQIGSLNGNKILLKGNHDLLPIENYLSVFEEVHGLLKYKEFWLSHAPIHPSELYGRTNIHGHCHKACPTEVHYHTVRHGDTPFQTSAATYFNTCAEHLPTPYKPIELEQVRAIVNERIKKGI